jgi:branched-chain amino acid transport system substrate-binding protein
MKPIAPFILVALTACGGSGDNTHRTEIHIASILPRTGAFANVYQIASGAMALAAQTINDAGGILGSDVVFDEYDEAPGASLQPVTDVANTLVDNGTQVWIGPYTSGSGLTIGPIAGNNQRLLITPSVGAASFSTIDDHDFAFRGVEPAFLGAVASASGAYEAGARTAAALHVNLTVGTELAGIFASAFAAKGGTVLANHGYTFDPANPGSFDPQAELDAVFAGNPDVIYLYGADIDAVTLLSAWDKTDWHGQWIVTSILGIPELAAAVGAAKTAGIKVYTSVAPDPAQQAIVNKAFEDLNGFPISGALTLTVNSALNSCFLAALAIEKAGAYNGARARDELRTIANAPGEQVVGAIDYAKALAIVRAGGDLDYVGLTSSIELDDNGDFPCDAAEVVFNASGGLDIVRTLVNGVDF